jgi:hypothetical protein
MLTPTEVGTPAQPLASSPQCTMARVTKVQLDQYAALKAEATELSRRVRALESEAKAIEVLAKVDLTESKKDSVTRGGYRLEWVDGRLSVSWKDELVARLGANIADEITKAAPRSKSLRITPPGVKVTPNEAAEAKAA